MGGAKPGDTIEFNVEVPSTKPQMRAEDVTPQMNTKEREEFLNSLPEEMRNEVLAQERMQRQQLTQTQQQRLDEPEDNMSADEKKAFYDALPPEIREEIMAQEIAQRRRISSTANIPQSDMPIDPHAHLQASPAAVVNEASDNASKMASMSLGQSAAESETLGGNTGESGASDQNLFDGMNVKENSNSSFTVNPIVANQPSTSDDTLLDLSSSESAVPPAPVPGLASSEGAREETQNSPVTQSNNPFAKTSTQAGAKPSAPETPLDRLRKAKELLNEGLIEQAEFDEIKRVVLLQLKGQ